MCPKRVRAAAKRPMYCILWVGYDGNLSESTVICVVSDYNNSDITTPDAMYISNWQLGFVFLSSQSEFCPTVSLMPVRQCQFCMTILFTLICISLIRLPFFSLSPIRPIRSQTIQTNRSISVSINIHRALNRPFNTLINDNLLIIHFFSLSQRMSTVCLE